MYDRIFEDPAIRALFDKPLHDVTRSQPVALANAIVAYAKNIDNLGALAIAVERIAQKHFRASVVPAHYQVVAEALNGEHPAVVALLALYEKKPEDPRIEAYGRLLYDQAVIAEGSKVKDPAAFARRINELLVKDAAG